MSARNGMPDSHSPPYAFIVKEIEIININDIKTMRERPENLTFLHPMLEFKEGIPYCFSGFKDINRSYICNGYLEGCDILHDLYKISPSFIINKQGNIKPGGSKIIISQDLSSAKYTELIKYLSTDDNKFKSPFIKIEGGDAINASGLSKSFSQDIGRYIKEEFMYDFIEKKLCTLPLQSGGASAPANTPSNNKSKIKTDIDLSPKNFIISKLTDDVIPGLSNVLAYYAFTYNRLNYDKFRASLGINFSSFTIMMLFNIFSERTKISLSEVFNILLGFVDLFELTDQDRDESYDSTKFLEKKLSTNPNKTEDIMRLFKIIDRYIGIFYAINDEYFQNDNIIIKTSIMKGSYHQPYPFDELINLVKPYLFTIEEQKTKVLKLEDVFFDYVKGIRNYVPILEEIIRRLLVLEELSLHFLELYEYNENNLVVYEEGQEEIKSISVFELGKCISEPNDITFEKIKSILNIRASNPDDVNANNFYHELLSFLDEAGKKDPHTLYKFVSYITGNIILPQIINIKLIDGTGPEPNSATVAHTCSNTLDVYMKNNFTPEQILEEIKSNIESNLELSAKSMTIKGGAINKSRKLIKHKTRRHHKSRNNKHKLTFKKHNPIHKQKSTKSKLNRRSNKKK